MDGNIGLKQKSEDKMETILKIENLNKSFGHHQVLHNVSMEVKRGELIGYIGPNGSGKSTTVKLILGILDDYSGEIEIFGQNIRSAGVEYKKKIGYVPEILSLYETLTGAEYLAFLAEVYNLTDYQQRVQDLAEVFGLNDALHTRISSYSKGMKQKIAIIGSLIHNPDILFLDEPVNGMDTNSVAVFKEVLKTLTKQGKTIFYSSHIMELVEQMSSRVILLKEGHVIADATMEELRSAQPGSNLEAIFNELTGFHEGHDLASKFVESLMGGSHGEL